MAHWNMRFWGSIQFLVFFEETSGFDFWPFMATYNILGPIKRDIFGHHHFVLLIVVCGNRASWRIEIFLVSEYFLVMCHSLLVVIHRYTSLDLDLGIFIVPRSSSFMSHCSWIVFYRFFFCKTIINFLFFSSVRTNDEDGCWNTLSPSYPQWPDLWFL